MYKFKEGLNIKFNQKKASEIIGLTEASLSNILNRKVTCRKVTAYCITKYINENAEIENYFDKVGE